MDPTNPNPSADSSGDKVFFPLSGKQPDPTPPAEPVTEPAPEPVEVTVMPAPVEPEPAPEPAPEPTPEAAPADTPAEAVSEPTSDPLPNIEIPTAAVDLSGVNVENTVITTDDKKAPKPLTDNFQSTDPTARPVAPISTKGGAKGGSKKNLIILLVVIIVIAIGAFVGMQFLPDLLAGGGTTTPPATNPPTTPTVDPTEELILDMQEMFSQTAAVVATKLPNIEPIVDEDLDFTIAPQRIILGIPDDATIEYRDAYVNCAGSQNCIDQLGDAPNDAKYLAAVYLNVKNASSATRFATASLSLSNGFSSGLPYDAVCDDGGTDFIVFCEEFYDRFTSLLYGVDYGKTGEGWVFFTLDRNDPDATTPSDPLEDSTLTNIVLTYSRAESISLPAFSFWVALLGTAPEK